MSPHDKPPQPASATTEITVVTGDRYRVEGHARTSNGRSSTRHAARSWNCMDGLGRNRSAHRNQSRVCGHAPSRQLLGTTSFAGHQLQRPNYRTPDRHDGVLQSGCGRFKRMEQLALAERRRQWVTALARVDHRARALEDATNSRGSGGDGAVTAHELGDGAELDPADLDVRGRDEPTGGRFRPAKLNIAPTSLRRAARTP